MGSYRHLEQARGKLPSALREAAWAKYEKGMHIQRIMFCFWTIDGHEGYVVAQRPYPYTAYHIRILGHRYVRWILPGDMDVPALKKRIAHYFDIKKEHRDSK